MPIYFSWLITALLSISGDVNNHNLPQSGRLFILRVIEIFANWQEWYTPRTALNWVTLWP